jgi:hypothetical protein
MREGILRDAITHAGRWEWRDWETGAVLWWLNYAVDTTGNSRWVRLQYTLAGTNETVICRVALLTTPLHFGSVKWWFRCAGCRRRARMLYLPSGQKYFACRRCYRLGHRTQREDAGGRAREKARKIRLRLGGSGSLMEPFPWRPKGQWLKTYVGLWEKADAAEERFLNLFGAWIDRAERRVAALLQRRCSPQ